MLLNPTSRFRVFCFSGLREVETLKIEVRWASSERRKFAVLLDRSSHSHHSLSGVALSRCVIAALSQHVFGFEVDEFRTQAIASGGSLPIRHCASNSTGMRR